MLKLQAVDLSKSYRGRKVVDDVELEIGQGEVVGLLGPNGAGKTTTFYIMVGLARPDSGRVLLNGEDVTEALREPEISDMASKVSAVPAVRHALLFVQRAMAEKSSVATNCRETLIFTVDSGV